jgi:amidase
MDWQQKASQKRASLYDAIPPAWRLNMDDVPSVSQLPDVTTFITQYLNPFEQQITNAAPAVILDKIRHLNWTAVEVCRAFCHRAALAHQLVTFDSLGARISVRD